MVNLEHKLELYDLMVEYMMYKVKNGYEPSFTTREFLSFLCFFENEVKVLDDPYNDNEFFQSFFERKYEDDWNIIKNFRTMECKTKLHMEMIYSEKEYDYLIKANYKLSDFDSSVIVTNFISKTKREKLRNIIGKWLSNYPKRKIDDSVEVDEYDLMIGKYVAAEIIVNIWDRYINKQIKTHQWPMQCMDIDKYLLKIDLAEIINLKSIKKELIELYSVLSKRIAILYHQDTNLHISTYTNLYLARANYELIIQGYEKIMGTTFRDYKKSLDIDLSNLTFKERHKIDRVYDWDENSDLKTTTTTVGNEKIKKLVKSLDESGYNK